MRKLLCLASLLAVGLLAFASSGSAGTVNWFGSCYQNGTATTTAGPLQLKMGWFTVRRGQLTQFLGVQYVRYTINGVSTQTATGDTTIQVLVVKNWGRPNEERQAVTRRLKDKQEVLDIADIEFKK